MYASQLSAINHPNDSLVVSNQLSYQRREFCAERTIYEGSKSNKALESYTSGGAKAAFAWAGLGLAAVSNSISNMEEHKSGKISAKRAGVPAGLDWTCKKITGGTCGEEKGITEAVSDFTLDVGEAAISAGKKQSLQLFQMSKAVGQI